MNERKLTKSELAKREDIIMKMKDNKRALVQKYGKDAEAVMYGRATNLAKKKSEGMDQDKIKELVKDALQNPKKADLNKDGKLSDYEKKRGAAIEKAMVKELDLDLKGGTEKDKDADIAGVVGAEDVLGLEEMDLNDPIAMRLRADKMKKPDFGKEYGDAVKKVYSGTNNDTKIAALKKRRAQLMRDMEQEAEMEGGSIADKYGDMLNKLDKAIAMLSEDTLQEGFYGPGGVESITNALGYSDPYEFFEDNPGAVDALLNWAEMVPEFNEMLQDADFLQEDLDLGHQDDEPHMLKADLYRIGKYAMELYQMVDRFEEGSEEVDFPHWWQAKVIKAKDMLVSAKHYLDFEIKEPQIDAMVDVAAEEDIVDENSAFQKRLAKLAADEKAKRDENPGYAAAGKELSKVDFEDFFKKGQSYGEFKKRLNKLEEGVWSLGSSKEIKNIIGILDIALDIKDPQELMDLMDMHDKSMYNIVGDDVFHDDIDGAKRELAQNNLDAAYNRLIDAKGRAEDLLKMVTDRESSRPYPTDIFEEEAGEADMVASDIQKAMNAAKGDDAKLHQLQLARKAMNKGDLDKAKKIVGRYLEEGLPKGYWDKKMDAKDEVNEDYEALVKKIKKQGKSEKAAKAIAGAVASYKAKGGGKGPTAKQKARG